MIGLYKITINDLINTHKKIIGDDYEFNINSTWVDMGYDELDTVEFIMRLESNLDISIPDDIMNIFDNSSGPSVFKPYIREGVLNSLGI